MRTYQITSDDNHPMDQFYGFAVYESGGSNAVTVLFKVAASGGALIFPLELAAGESAAIIFPKALPGYGGVYVDVSGTGTLTGVLFGEGE